MYRTWQSSHKTRGSSVFWRILPLPDWTNSQRCIFFACVKANEILRRLPHVLLETAVGLTRSHRRREYRYVFLQNFRGESIILVDTGSCWWRRRKAGLAAACRVFGVDFTTARASTRTTRQTSHVSSLRWMEGAHPNMLFNLLRGNRVALARRIARNGLPNTLGRRGTAIHGRSVTVGGRRSAATAAHRGTVRISGGLACATPIVHSWRATGSLAVLQLIKSRGRQGVGSGATVHGASVDSTIAIR